MNSNIYRLITFSVKESVKNQIVKNRTYGTRQNFILILCILCFGCTLSAQQNIWNGNTDTDWNTATNWSLGTVPVAGNDVLIDNAPANQPILSSGTAPAKHVEVEAGATLTINSGATLNIMDSNSGSRRNHGLLVLGNVSNSGIINISNTNEHGIYTLVSGGVITNSGTISVNTIALNGFFNEGTFTNQSSGIFNIGTTGGANNIGGIGIRNERIVENQSGGIITIDNIATNEGGVNTSSAVSFTNSGTLTIKKAGLRGFRHNVGTFTNSATGIINIGDASNAVSGDGFLIESTFTNDGTINIENTGGRGLFTLGSATNTATNNGVININNAGNDGFVNDVNFVNNNAVNIGTISGNITNQGFENPEQLTVTIEGTTPKSVSGYGQIDVVGTLALAGTLVLSGSFAPAIGDAFVIINNDGTDAVVGTFSGLAEGAIVTFNGVDLTLSYLGGDGNDVTLSSIAPVNLTLSDGDLVITGSTANEDLEINYSSPNYLIISNQLISTTIPGATGSGATTVTIPESSIGGITVDLQDGTDRLFVSGLPGMVNGDFTVMDGNDFDQTFINVVLNTTTNDILIGTERFVINAAGGLFTTTGSITVNANINSTITNPLDALIISGSISTETGAINLTGRGGTTGNSDGIQLLNGASITSTGMSGAGNIMIDGRTTSVDNAADGIISQTVNISSADAAISMLGSAAGGEGITTGVTTITAMGDATVTLNGTNTFAANNNRAISLNAAVVSSMNGDISLTCNGTDDGIFLFSNTAISSSGTGNISLDGTTNNAGDQAVGLFDGSSISTTSGNIQLTAIGGNNDLRFGGTSSSVNSGSGNLILTSDQIEFTNTLLQGTGNLTIQPNTVSSSIGIGGGTGDLQIMDASLLTIQDGFSNITIGDATNGTGTITIQSAIFTDPVTFSGGTIVDADDASDDVATATNLVTIDGDLSPGSSPGIFQVTGNVALTSGDNFNIEVNGATTAGTDYDQLKVVGTVDLAAVTLNLSGTHTPATDNTFIIVDNDGSADAVTGTFSGLVEGATVTLNGEDLTISYVGGDGNDVTLTFAPVLPVELLDFTARPEREKVLLTWKTANEINNEGFLIERRADANTWEAIGFENGKGSAAIYEFIDEKPFSGNNYYRLKQLDFDGKFEYSQIEQVIFYQNDKILVYPNPMRLHLTIEGFTGNMDIFNNAQQKLKSVFINSHISTLYFNDLPNGIYFLVFKGENGETSQHRLIKQ